MIKPLKDLTNEEFVVYVMNFSRRGALVQAFVIEALSKYSAQVLEADLSSMENGIVSPEAWRDLAAEMKERLEAKYEH